MDKAHIPVAPGQQLLAERRLQAHRHEHRLERGQQARNTGQQPQQAGMKLLDGVEAGGVRGVGHCEVPPLAATLEVEQLALKKRLFSGDFKSWR